MWLLLLAPAVTVNLVIEILRSGAPLDGRAQLAGCAAGERQHGYFANNANPVVILTTVASQALLTNHQPGY